MNLFLFFAILFSSFSLNAQQPGLFLEGTVKEDKSKLSGALVSVLLGGRMVNSLVTPSNGLFSFTLNYNSEYVLQFSKEGYATKRISVSTKNVPPEEAGDIYEFTGFEVSLFKSIPDLDVSILEKPIGKISFVNSDEGFDYDAKYTASIQAELQKFLAELVAKQKMTAELEAKYKVAVSKADKAFSSKNYELAKTTYYEASGYKPDEKYPKDKITELDDLLSGLASKDAAEKERLAKEKEINDKYIAAIVKADKALAGKDYSAAKSAYNEASALKPNEQYPKNKMNEAEKALSDLAAKESSEKANSEKYNSAIAKADNSFSLKDYSSAKSSYTEASGIKPSEKYPKDKIAEIEKLLAAQAAADAAKAKAEEDARKKAEAEAAARKKAEEETAAKEKAITEKYNATIAKADKAFTTKDYGNAKTAYTEASEIKSSEKYPQEKLSEIAKILAQLAAKESSEKEIAQKYADAVSRADKAFAAKDYNGSKSTYNEASGLKPSEQYPKTKISEIDKILGDIAAKDAADKAATEKYNALLAKADKAFGGKDYNGAKSIYSDASVIKPAEKYPKDKIAEIDALLAQIADADDAKRKADEEARKKYEADAAEKNSKYTTAISKADKQFATKDYAGAKTSYTEASGIKPAEKYPKDKINEIDNLLAQLTAVEDAKRKADEEARAKSKADEEARNKSASEAAKALNEKYNSMISKADKEFNSKNYNDAKASYTDASKLKPGEKYPKDKIAQIDKLAAAELAAKKKAEEEAKQAAAGGTKEDEKEKVFVDMKEDTTKGPVVITKQKDIKGTGTIKGKGNKKKTTNVVF